MRKYRRLGRNGPQVSASVMGPRPQSVGSGRRSKQNSTRRSSARSISASISSIARTPTGERATRSCSRALKGRRNDALIATKFGNIDLPDGKKATNGRPEYVHKCCDASLQRMGVDVIDIYYLHRVDPNVPIEDTVGAMAELISRGKVRFIGICEASAKTLRRAYAEHPLTALQTEYSLWFRESEKDILPACKELGVGYIAPMRRWGVGC